MPQPITKTLERMLDYSALKQKVINKNIANIGTEGYKREDVQFRDILAENMSADLKTTRSQHFDINGMQGNSELEVVNDPDGQLYSGVNNVNIDTEMAEMAENSLKFKFASKKMADYYKNLQNVIRGSR